MYNVNRPQNIRITGGIVTEEGIVVVHNIRSVWWAGVSMNIPSSEDDASLLKHLEHPGVANHFTEKHHENGRRGYAVPNAGFPVKPR